MTLFETQAIEFGAAAAWVSTAVAAALAPEGQAKWGNVITSLIVGAAATADLIASFLVSAPPISGRRAIVGLNVDSQIWVVSSTPDIWVVCVALIFAIAAIFLSLGRQRGGQRRFWFAWLLNAPAVLVGVAVSVIGSFAQQLQT